LGLAINFGNRLSLRFDARRSVEKILRFIFFSFSTVAVLTTFGIILSLIFETVRFFSHVSFFEFLFGTHWSPQTAIREDQIGSSGSFGAVPIFTGTLLITFIAMIIAAPLGLFSAIYLSQYAKPRVRNYFKPILEILAGIPTVVYGFFAALSVGPLIRSIGQSVGLTVSTESALAAGLIMGIMIIPYVSSLSDDVMSAVPENLRDGSLALGATQSETIRKVIFPAALPGIVGALLLAISRAIGETMIVVMAAGLAANVTVVTAENGLTVTFAANPAAITTIIVSPIALEIANKRAPTIPGRAAGKMTFRMVSDCVAPKARDPSLKFSGTADITSSDKDETYGIIIIPIIKPAAKADSVETVKPTDCPIDLINGPTESAAKKP
jgi:phosphate transport system permease protein